MHYLSKSHDEYDGVSIVGGIENGPKRTSSEKLSNTPHFDIEKVDKDNLFSSVDSSSDDSESVSNSDVEELDKMIKELKRIKTLKEHQLIEVQEEV